MYILRLNWRQALRSHQILTDPHGRRAERKFQRQLADADLTCMICRQVREDEHAAFECTLGHLAAATDMTREIDEIIRAAEGREAGGNGT
jgi:hypothetical protein